MSEATLGFSYTVRGAHEVELLRHGRKVVVLRGRSAADFLAEVSGLSPDSAQQAMARATGNYKRGNERLASQHPRNRR